MIGEKCDARCWMLLSKGHDLPDHCVLIIADIEDEQDRPVLGQQPWQNLVDVRTGRTDAEVCSAEDAPEPLSQERGDPHEDGHIRLTAHVSLPGSRAS